MRENGFNKFGRQLVQMHLHQRMAALSDNATPFRLGRKQTLPAILQTDAHRNTKFDCVLHSVSMIYGPDIGHRTFTGLRAVMTSTSCAERMRGCGFQGPTAR